MQARLRKSIPKPSDLTVSQPKKIPEMNWEEYQQFWVDAISDFREKGLITDEHLRRSPRLVRAIKSFLRK